MKLLLGGGGSGGHIFPALAVASALRDHIHEDLDLLYVGTETGVESRIVPEAGIRFRVVASRGVRGRHALSKAWSLATMGVGVWDAVRIIRDFRPDAVLLTGGYASVPVGLAAWLNRRPIVVFQPDIEPGWAIRLLTRIATKVCVTEAQSLHRLPANKGTATGYPLRPVFNEIDRPMARARFGLNGTPSILVSGSIQGAHQINAAIDDNLEEWVSFAQLIHVTGEKDARHMAQRREDLPEELRHRYQPIDYLGDELPTAMAACDLAISRAGASVLAEYPAAGLASILIPLPGAGGHQRHNAQALTDAGAAVVVDDAKVATELLGTTRSILEDSERLAEMRRRSAAKARIDAAERIAEVLWEVRRD
jgi:UDP-N-acetylglucosamine--N-acetylmuramyl-(pentapeptide) pyrophosphoryl-undecaprenol N-acetylglucosamine transferase